VKRANTAGSLVPVSMASLVGKPTAAYSGRSSTKETSTVSRARVSLLRLFNKRLPSSILIGSSSQPLEQTWEWTEIAEESRHPSRGVFINLVKNPEKFTGPLLSLCPLLHLIFFSGYSGPSARLVWKSIQEENCFGGDNDACFEKRVFYR
jgi:hypothetical protein